jgi:4a-hydroxytetrahydrobiopterin dehydratase
MKRLDEQQIQTELEKRPDWERTDEKWIVRKYRFKKYLDGVDFASDAANYAESIKHHPLITIDYKKVTLKMSSWQAKGLTDLDFEMAAHFDELYNQIDE